MGECASWCARPACCPSIKHRSCCRGPYITTLSLHAASQPQMPESVADVSNHWVRFTSANPPLVLEAAVQMQAVPADPAIWTLRWALGLRT